MSKHTPGPWVMFSNGVGIGVGARGVDVAWTQHKSSGLIYAKRQSDEDEANARLIAAAPELLDALKAALDGFVWVNKNFGDCLSTQKLEDAIAKATGESA